MPSLVPSQVTLERRRFLLGAAGTVVLAACGGGDSDETGVASDGTGRRAEEGAGDGRSPGGDDAGLAVFTLFDGRSLEAGGPVRAPIGLGDIDGFLRVEDSPEQISVTITRDGDTVDTLNAELHADGLPRGYYPLRFEPPTAGFYDLAVASDRYPTIQATMEVAGAGSVLIPGPGDPFPRVDTPTVDDARGVTPICTRDPMCPLHERNLVDVLDDDRPSVVLVSTPAFCSTAVCGPVLDLLLAERDSHPEISMLHAEVYADPETDLSTVAPLVQEMGFTFEPSLVLIDADGVIEERIDFVFDTSELRSALDRLEA